MYVSFLQDGFSRQILWFTVTASKTVELIFPTLAQAVSVGRVDTARVNALIESTIGQFKTELVRRRAPGWDGREEIALATARWVARFNRDRLHEMLAYFTPIEVAYVRRHSLAKRAA